MLLQPAAHLVHRIANERMTGIGHVNTNLVRSASRDLDAEERLIVPLLEHERDAMRRTPAFARRLDGAEDGMRNWTNRHIDHEHFGACNAEAERAIGLLDRAFA